MRASIVAFDPPPQILGLADIPPQPAADAPRTHTAPTDLSFGPFRLLASQFLLLEDGKPVHVGSRALEILIALLERPGELISKQELMSRVWPNVFVEPNNLTVNICTLRRALRDGQDGNRFVINVPGRGYSFVGEVAAIHPSPAVAPAEAAAWS